MIRVSGVFRKMLTHAVPNARSTGTGETRIAASSTPQARASTADAPVSLRIQRKPAMKACWFSGSVKTCIRTLPRCRWWTFGGGHAARPRTRCFF